MAIAAGEQFALYAVARSSANRCGPPRVGQRRYSRPEILEAMRAWAGRYGEPPRVVDWEPARARRLGEPWRAARFESGEWPTAGMVRAQFGQFNAAIEEAGLPARHRPRRVAAAPAGPEAILVALVAWARRYGDIPTLADWDPHRARTLGQEWRIARYHQGDWPSARTVVNHFGSFSNAVAAAGLLPGDRRTPRVAHSAALAAGPVTVARPAATSRQPGIKDLAESLRILAAARRTHDPVSLHAALLDVAAAALACAGIVGAE
jgi:hypothetical protein